MAPLVMLRNESAFGMTGAASDEGRFAESMHGFDAGGRSGEERIARAA
jgi:hypothetical protein